MQILVAYAQANGAALIQCSSPDSTLDNLSYLFDRNMPAKPALEVPGARFIKADLLAEDPADGVPDRFGPVAWCPSPKRPAAVAGELLLISKVPRDKLEPPFCYRLLRVANVPTGLALRAEDGGAVAVLPAATPKWNGLRDRLLPLMTDVTANVAVQEGVMLTVSSAKARLFGLPDATAAPHGYLVAGDTVQVLDESKRPLGWVKVRYVTKSGSVIEPWVRVGDLQGPAAEPSK